jgi:hypothetical protein
VKLDLFLQLFGVPVGFLCILFFESPNLAQEPPGRSQPNTVMRLGLPALKPESAMEHIQDIQDVQSDDEKVSSPRAHLLPLPGGSSDEELLCFE